MPSRVQHLPQHSAPTKSSTVKQSNRACDIGKSESRFADTLKRARTDDCKTEPKEAEKSVPTKSKPRAAKAKKTERATEIVDETMQPPDSAVVTESAHQGETKPTDETTDVIDGETIVAEDDIAPVAEDTVAEEASSFAPNEMLLTAQSAAVPTAPMDDVVDAPVENRLNSEAPMQATAPIAKTPIITPLQTRAAETSELEVTGDVAVGDAEDAGGALEMLAAVGRKDSTDEAEDSFAPAPSDVVALQTAQAPPKPAKPEAQSVVAKELATSDAPADTEIMDAVKPVQANLESPDSDADPKLDFAQPSADKADPKATIVATTAQPTAQPTADISAALAPVAPASNYSAPTLTASQTPPVIVPEFAETNHDAIVTSLRSSAFAKGGTMEIRLDPPELGALQVSVKMQDGVMTASFQTSNDEATRLLSHSLGQLKYVLESAGVTVDKLQVQQAPRNDNDTSGDGRHHSERDDSSARQEQQRKEMIKRMWRKLSGVSDPLDLVA